MIWRFCSGSTTPRSSEKKCPAASIDFEPAQVEPLEGGLNLFGLAGAHESGIDVDAMNQLRPQRAHRQGVGDGRVDAAAQEKQHAPLVRGAANGFDKLRDAVLGMPVHAAAADARQKIAQDLGAVRGVDDLGMELQAEIFAIEVAHGGHGALARAGQDA